MNTYQNPFMAFPGTSPEEINFLQQATNDLTETQKQNFFMIYSGKRRNSQDILLLTLFGFIGIAGVQRFVVGQIGLGLLYFFTGGLFLVGTIVDLVNNKAIADEFNKKMVYESFQMAKMIA